MCTLRQAAVKILSRVEILSTHSNQHEFHGVSALRRLFGDARIENMNGDFYFVRSDGRIFRGQGNVTWYDARESSADRTGRSEYRLYYNADTEGIMAMAQEGDTLVITTNADGCVVRLIIIARGVLFLDVLAHALDGTLSDGEYHFVTDLAQMRVLNDMLGI